MAPTRRPFKHTCRFQCKPYTSRKVKQGKVVTDCCLAGASASANQEKIGVFMRQPVEQQHFQHRLCFEAGLKLLKTHKPRQVSEAL